MSGQPHHWTTSVLVVVGFATIAGGLWKAADRVEAEMAVVEEIDRGQTLSLDVGEREVAEMPETLEFQEDTAPELMGNLILGPIMTWIEAEGLFHEDAKPPWKCDILELSFPSSLGTISFTLPGAPEDGPRIEVNGVEHRLVKAEGGAG